MTRRFRSSALSMRRSHYDSAVLPVQKTENFCTGNSRTSYAHRRKGEILSLNIGFLQSIFSFAIYTHASLFQKNLQNFFWVLCYFNTENFFSIQVIKIANYPCSLSCFLKYRIIRNPTINKNTITDI
jgi:hypothetical protein